MRKILKWDYKIVAKYALLFIGFLLFSKLEQEVYIYPLSLYIVSLFFNCSIIFSSLLYISSYLILGEMGLLGQSAISVIFLSIVFLIYRRYHYIPKYEFIIYSVVSTLGFVFLGDTTSEILIQKRVLTAVLTVVLSFFCLIAFKAIIKKGIKFKFDYTELACCAVVLSLLGIGISNSLGSHIFKGIAIFSILISSFLGKRGTGAFLSAILGISYSLYYSNIIYVAVFMTLGVITDALMPISKYLSMLGIIFSDYLIELLFQVYGMYTLTEFLPVFLGTLLFCLIPHRILVEFKNKLLAFREKQLVRQTINRNRTMLSNRLFELSEVFTEMALAFNGFKKSSINEEQIKLAITKDINKNVCENCSSYEKCSDSKKKTNGITKLIDIGFAKGKISLIDLPKDLSEICFKPNNIIFAVNKQLADLRARTIENVNVITGRNLIAQEVQGISEILKGLALESGTMLKYQSKIEKELSEKLFQAGFIVSELLIYGEAENTTVSMIITMKEFSIPELVSILSGIFNTNMTVIEKANITENKCYLSFKKSADYDAVFGIACCKKEGSTVSGDTHSVIRIKDDKFLVALSDGMGSGEQAEAVSSASLNLIESFYKAGLNENLILNTVNKLLAINTEDSFTALDVSVINLKNCTADFIKYGSPYGFIIGNDGIKIVEGNTLPLGILDELKPAVCHTKLSDGDIIVLFSDGVSDAFGSGAEVIEYLKSIPAYNPQTLADSILSKALSINNQEKKDDMTVLAVRVFKRLFSA